MIFIHINDIRYNALKVVNSIVAIYSLLLSISWSPSPAPPGPTALVIVVMTRHGALYPLLLPLWLQVIRL